MLKDNPIIVYAAECRGNLENCTYRKRTEITDTETAAEALVFTLASSETVAKQWQDRSRAESWTEEMRSAVGKKARERNERNAQG